MSKEFIIGFRITFILLLLICGGLWSAFNIYPTYDVVKGSVKIENVDDSKTWASQYTCATIEFDIIHKNVKKHVKLTPYIAECGHESCNRHFVYIDNTTHGKTRVDMDFINDLNDSKIQVNINVWMAVLFAFLLGAAIIYIVSFISMASSNKENISNRCINCNYVVCPMKITYIPDDYHKKVNKFFGYHV